MPKAHHGVASRRRRKGFIKQAKGFWGGRRRLYTVARDSVMRSMAYATRDRKVRKRDFRRLWVVRISAACRAHGITYSKLIKGLKEAKVALDRKILADMALHDTNAFQKLVELAKNPSGGR
ncbi:MAG: 50S ribosomal protein L20 [Candidatus Omnitrophota bacterium]